VIDTLLIVGFALDLLAAALVREASHFIENNTFFFCDKCRIAFLLKVKWDLIFVVGVRSDASFLA
jgi:hypothetical protein